jgi:hypothetical protein
MAIPLIKNTYRPVQGQTYTLFGDGITTYKYFNQIDELIDNLSNERELEKLLETVRKLSKLSLMRRIILKNKADNKIEDPIISDLAEKLAVYTQNNKKHLHELSRLSLKDKVVWITEKQQHLFMLEIGILNRLNQDKFKSAHQKIALLPYCLRDEQLDCKAEKKGFDKVCVECSKGCLLGIISKILKKKNIEAYLWSGKSLKPIFSQYVKKNESIGVLGIACIPELRRGMLKVSKANIPVIGHPLNANRCSKWMGKLYPNNIDLLELEDLLGKN